MCQKQLWLLSVSELWPFDCVFMLHIIYILVHAITHSEFSQNSVSGTRINVPPPSKFESDVPSGLANVPILCR